MKSNTAQETAGLIENELSSVAVPTITESIKLAKENKGIDITYVMDLDSGQENRGSCHRVGVVLITKTNHRITQISFEHSAA